MFCLAFLAWLFWCWNSRWSQTWLQSFGWHNSSQEAFDHFLYWNGSWLLKTDFSQLVEFRKYNLESDQNIPEWLCSDHCSLRDSSRTNLRHRCDTEICFPSPIVFHLLLSWPDWSSYSCSLRGPPRIQILSYRRWPRTAERLLQACWADLVGC